jgi:hypothetical protein
MQLIRKLLDIPSSSLDVTVLVFIKFLQNTSYLRISTHRNKSTTIKLF